METRAGYLIVGTFVLLLSIGILTFFLWIAKMDFDYKVKYYTIYFPGSVTGLTLGGPVNYLGVPVGTVKDIKLDLDTPDRVNVLVGLKENISIREDSFASLELQGLTGYKFVQISGGSKDSPLLKAKKGELYPVIPSRYSGVEEIMTTLPRMVNKFANLIDRINATFNEANRERFSDALKNVDILAQNLAESAAPLKDLIKDTRKAMNTFDTELQHLGRSTDSALLQVEGVAKDIHQLLKENRIAIDSLTQTGSYEILQTLTETREMVTTARQFFEKLDENPRSLFFDSQRKGIYVPRQ
ncbi:MlaD family protein [Geitlerinema splendidum]|jgi:phospholipid/cholesterol/gamma-HCH transport system substrate-binding protein|nr:MlaD family protein [Geitlerinema splendidum]